MISNDGRKLVHHLKQSDKFLFFSDKITIDNKDIIFIIFNIFISVILLLLSPNLHCVMLLPKAVLCLQPPVHPTLLTDLLTPLVSHLPPAAVVPGRAATDGERGGGPTTPVPAGASSVIPRTVVPFFLAAGPLLKTSLLATPPTTAAIARLSQRATQEV